MKPKIRADLIATFTNGRAIAKTIIDTNPVRIDYRIANWMREMDWGCLRITHDYEPTEWYGWKPGICRGALLLDELHPFTNMAHRSAIERAFDQKDWELSI